MAIPRVAVAFGGFGCQLISEGIITAMDVFPPYIFNYFKCTIAEASLFHSVLHGLSELLGEFGSCVLLVLPHGSCCFCLFVFGSLLVRPNEPEAPVTKSPSQEELETYSGEVTAISEKEVRVTELRPLPFFGRFVVPILLLSSFLWHIGHYTYEVMPLRLDHEGYNGDQIALVVSLQAIFVVVGRFSASSVTTKFKADPVFAYTFFTLIFAIARIIISWTWALKSYLVIIAFCGVSIGVVTALMPCVVLKLVGLERLDFIFGLELLVRGIGGIVMPVFGGWLADVFDQNYFYTFMVGGISLLLSAILLIPYHWPLLRAAEIENTKVEKR
ncbi:unnamed protein product [Soboliphyme baturini]|uniref:MFS domain-containing protein n=1 Tax=Soboliphyme baturini TaxID=241478 RepID=A0A183IVB6_9BILA|nr:unnamed protein product [Soboliphyme baturini]